MEEKQYPDRQSLRLKSFDYSRNGAYFVTVCTHKRQRLFGQPGIPQVDMKKSNMLTDGITQHHHRVGRLESNVGATLCGRPEQTPLMHETDAEVLPLQNQITHCQDSITLSDIVGWFKTMTTNEYIKGVKQGLYEPFDQKMWQRNYYERIIRGEDELYEMRCYISENPIRWNMDGEEPF